MIFPILHYKTPLEEKKIKYNGKFYLVNTRIEICIYKIEKENYCSVISRDIIFSNEKSETILLNYIHDKKTYEDVFDFTTAFMDTLTI